VAPPYIPPIADVLHLAPPTAAMWAIILALSLAPMLVIQTVTLIVTRRQSRS
jgi:Ca2+-transporting ATPase